jgi:hypothetical protein
MFISIEQPTFQLSVNSLLACMCYDCYLGMDLLLHTRGLLCVTCLLGCSSYLEQICHGTQVLGL